MAEKKTSDVFSAEEKAAMKEAAAERKAQEKATNKREAGTKAVRDAIEKLDGSDRTIAERFYALVSENAPDLVPKTYYGMPGFANADDKILVFMQPASKFKVRYSTIGFEQPAKLDDKPMWPTAWGITEWTAADEKAFLATLKKAIG
jgi:uncharacterized protein YdhG (YjbR/CyaY superfamily)